MGREKYEVQKLPEGAGAPQTFADPVKMAVKGEGEQGSRGRAGNRNRNSGVRLRGNGSSPLSSRSMVGSLATSRERGLGMGARVSDDGGGGNGRLTMFKEVVPSHTNSEDGDYQDKDLPFARAMLLELRAGTPPPPPLLLIETLLHKITLVEGVEHLGLKHEMTLQAMLSLLAGYRDEGRFKNTLPAVKLASRISALVYGALHLQTIIFNRTAVEMLIKQEKWSDAEAKCVKQ